MQIFLCEIRKERDMRKLSMIISVTVLFTMLLAACGANTPNTTVPPTTGPIATNVVSTSTPLATEITASETPNTAVTDTPQSGTTAVVPVTGQSNPSRLSAELNFGVWDQNGNQIGKVEDM